MAIKMEAEHKRVKRKAESALMVASECLELLGKADDAGKVRRILRRLIKVRGDSWCLKI